MSRGGVQVNLRSGLPDARAAWDQAKSLGTRLLESRPDLAHVEVVVNRNRNAVLRWGLRGDRLEVSVHWSLLPRPIEVIAVLDEIPGAWPRLRPQLDARADHPPPPRTLRTLGDVHDLAAVAAHQSAWVPTPDGVQITWGRFSGRAPRRSLRLGSCAPGPPPLIRIHPVLDHPSVPGWFVGFVLFHEFLHIAHPPVTGPLGRRQVHPPSFVRAECEHPDWARATAWERDHVGKLLARAARSRVHARFASPT